MPRKLILKTDSLKFKMHTLNSYKIKYFVFSANPFGISDV